MIRGAFISGNGIQPFWPYAVSHAALTGGLGHCGCKDLMDAQPTERHWLPYVIAAVATALIGIGIVADVTEKPVFRPGVLPELTRRPRRRRRAR